MPIQTQILTIPFRAGLDEKTQDEVLEPGQAFVTIENRVQTKAGGFDKRNGFSRYSRERQDGTSASKGVSLFALGTQKVMYDGTRYDTLTTDDKWVKAGEQRNYSLEMMPVHTANTAFGDASDLDRYDIAYCNGHLAIFHYINSFFNFASAITVIEIESGVTVLEKNMGNLVIGCRLGSVGNKFIAIYTDSANTFKAIDLDVGTLGSPSAAWSAPSTITSTWTNLDWDVSSVRDLGSTNTGVLLVYTSSTGYTTSRLTSAATVTHTVVTGAIAAAQHVSIGGDESSGVAYVTFTVNMSSSVYARALNPTTCVNISAAATMGTVAGVVPYRLGVCSTAANSFVVVAANEGTPPPLDTALAWIDGTYASGTITPGTTKTTWGWMTITKPFRLGGKTVVHAGYRGYNDTGNSQKLEYLMDLGSTYMTPVATVNARLSGWLNLGYFNTQRKHSALNAAVVGSDAYFVSYKLTNQVSTIPQVAKVSVDKPKPIACEMADGSHVAGANPTVYDGRWVIEDGFTNYPDLAVTSFTAGTDAVAFTAIYERVDSHGNVFWSAPAPPVSIECNASNNITVKVQGLAASHAYTSPNSVVNIALYRTTVDGSIYYRIDEQTANQKTATFLCLPIEDINLITHPVLYKQPGTVGTPLDRVNPPAFTCETVHQDRVFGANGETVWYSAKTVYGEGTWYSDVFQFTVERGGNITALSSLDGHLYVFKSDCIFYVDGDGPPENGGNGTEFSSPIELPTTVGCIDSRSVLRTPIGIMFRSSRGIELITRKQEVAFIGDAVEDHTDAYPNVTSAVLDEGQSRAIFTCATTETTEGVGSSVMLVYDFTVQMWSVLRVSDDVALGQAAAAILPTVYGQSFSFLANNGTVFYENPTTSIDNGEGDFTVSWVPTIVETPWIKMAGLEGYQRVRRVHVQNERKTPHDLIVSVAYDNSPVYTQTRRWLWSELVTFPTEEVEMHLAQQKCRAIRVKIEDDTPTGDYPATGRGCTLFGLAIEWGQKQGTNKLPAGQKS